VLVPAESAAVPVDTVAEAEAPETVWFAYRPAVARFKRVSVVLEVVPVPTSRTVPVERAGLAVRVAATVNVSPVVPAACAIANVTTVATPTRVGPTEPAVIPVGATVAALAGATEVNTPKPNAATATSAMRLKVVFVDICFLSISRSEEFPPVGFG
jgi:hypothetical protein